MKFGFHANEGVDDIIIRKQKEINQCKKMFWGYGGTLCHPVNQVVPFIREMAMLQEKVSLIMTSTLSRPTMPASKATQFSVDGKFWKNLEDGINVTGSKYALVCSSLVLCDDELNLEQYEVAIGPSLGKTASEYIRYRVDKGCFKRKRLNSEKTSFLKFQAYGELTPPYAVFVK